VGSGDDTESGSDNVGIISTAGTNNGINVGSWSDVGVTVGVEESDGLPDICDICCVGTGYEEGEREGCCEKISGAV